MLSFSILFIKQVIHTFSPRGESFAKRFSRHEVTARGSNVGALDAVTPVLVDEWEGNFSAITLWSVLVCAAIRLEYRMNSESLSLQNCIRLFLPAGKLFCGSARRAQKCFQIYC